MGMMADGKEMTGSSSTNYSYYQAKINLPRVTNFSQKKKVGDVDENDLVAVKSDSEEEIEVDFGAYVPSPISDRRLRESPNCNIGMFAASNKINNENNDCSKQTSSSTGSPNEKSQKTKRKKLKNKVNPSDVNDDGSIHNDDLFVPCSQQSSELSCTSQNSLPVFSETNDNSQQVDNDASFNSENTSVGSEIEKSNSLLSTENLDETTTTQNSLNKTNEEDLVNKYTHFLEKRASKDLDNTDTAGDAYSDNDSDISAVSSLSDSDDNSVNIDNNLVQGTFEPLYSLPLKNRNERSANIDLSKSLNKIVISNSKNSTNNDSLDLYQTGSLPELHSLNKCRIQKVSHVMKNDSEPESEPGAQIRYKVRPLPPIPGVPSTENDSSLYETLDKVSKKDIISRTGSEKRTFKQIATLLTLVPRVPTNQVRGRKDDHQLADILKYLPDRKLKIFVGTWNMKGTKYFPESLDDFLLPPESEFLQDVYVIGTQEGTPFRHEWQLKLQETFGPSHVLVQASNFGVLQLSVFVRRELVWFCSNVDQDTIATRVGHKIKTKGALAMSFSIFGTSFLFITSHFTSHEGKLRDRINDYNSICQNLNLPSRESSDDLVDKNVTNRFDRVFWFGDFNFRVRKTRSSVDKLIGQHSGNKRYIISELLAYDQLNDVRGKIFHGFSEASIHFMPTYKFDVHTDNYDTSTKQRVPSWTDRVLFKSVTKEHLEALSYNACETIKNSDHRPVYGIFETLIEPYKSKFVLTGARFDRDVYVEANMRRNAPTGNQSESHVCIIL